LNAVYAMAAAMLEKVIEKSWQLNQILVENFVYL
jgi:hypothetical protein